MRPERYQVHIPYSTEKIYHFADCYFYSKKMGCIKLSILDEQYKTEQNVSSHKELTFTFYAENERRVLVYQFCFKAQIEPPIDRLSDKCHPTIFREYISVNNDK